MRKGKVIVARIYKKNLRDTFEYGQEVTEEEVKNFDDLVSSKHIKLIDSTPVVEIGLKDELEETDETYIEELLSKYPEEVTIETLDDVYSKDELKALLENKGIDFKSTENKTELASKLIE